MIPSLSQAKNVFPLTPGLAQKAFPKKSLKVKMPPVEAYNIQLSNGIRLIVQPDHTAPVASVQAWVQAGSIMEGDFLGCGVSHFLEHMLFKGTKNRTGSEIVHTIHQVGGLLNAYTSFDRTVYYADLPSAGWETALDVIVDVVFRSTLPEDEFEKEREVIRREFAMGMDDPDREIQKLLFRTAYTTHPYRYPIIGHLNLFNQLTHEDLIRYYKEKYIPDNVTFIITGDVDPKKVEEKLAQLTSDIPRSSLPPAYIPPEPKQLGRREAHRSFPTDVVRLFMAWHIPPITHPDLYALDVLATIMGQGNSSALHQELVERRKILRSVDVFSYTPAQSGLWALAATLQPGQDRQKAQEAILSIIQKPGTYFKITRAELAKAKRQAITGRASDLKTASGRAASVGSSWFIAKDVHFDESYLQNLQEVTLKDLRRVARTYFADNNLTIVSLNPVAETVSSNREVKIQEKQKIQCLPLSNGSKLIVVPDNKVPLVTLRLVGLGGLLAETEKNNGIGKLTCRLLDQGTKKRTAQEIVTEIENLGGSISTEFGNNSFSLSIEVLESDFEKAVELLADMALNSTFPQGQIDKEKAKQLADLKIEADQPMAIARNKMRKTMFGDHPYALNPLGKEKTLKALTRKGILAYHRRLMVSKNVLFSVAGSFDVARAERLVERYFKPLPKGPALSRTAPPSFPKEELERIIPTEKLQAIVQIGYPGVTLESSGRVALEIIDEALSDLASRLFVRIREKQSLAYFVGCAQLVGLSPGYFIFYAGTASENSEKTRREILDEIQSIIQNGLTKEEIERARAKLLSQRLLANQSASAVGYCSALNEIYGLGVHFEDELNEKIRTIGVEEVNSVAAKYLSQPNFVSVIVQPNLKE